jgi:Tol biopolymer transport system component
MDQAEDRRCSTTQGHRSAPRRTTARLLAAMAVLVPALAALLPASPASAVFPGLNGKIAFASSRDGNSEIYTVNPDGSELTRLTNNAARDDSPQWNLTGTRIAFSSTRDGQSDIFVMNADGTAVTNLTPDEHSGSRPSWSPDGSRIAFGSGRDGKGSEVYVLTLATGVVSRLTTDSCIRFSAPGVLADESCEYGHITNYGPSWSPDGRLVAFLKGAGSSNSVHVMNADGSNQRILTEHASHANHIDWSPSGQQLAYSDHSQSIQVLNRDGSGEYVVPNTRQCPSSGNCFILQMPGWSPDGTKLVAATAISSGQTPGLFTFTPDGENMIQILADDTINSARPSWQASRTRLAVSSSSTTSTSSSTSTTTTTSTTATTTTTVVVPPTSTTMPTGQSEACVELARLWTSMESPLGMQLRQALAAALNCSAP